MDTLTGDRWTTPYRPAEVSGTTLLNHIRLAAPEEGKECGKQSRHVDGEAGRPQRAPPGFQALLVLLAKYQVPRSGTPVPTDPQDKK